MALTNQPLRLAVLGATGSIGKQALDIVRALPDKFKVISLSAGKNRKLLQDQIAEFKPRFVYYQGKPEKLPTGVKLVSPEEMAAQPDIDIAVIAIAGTAGLNPALAAIRAGKKVALANKESIVMAGEILTREAKRSKAKILPVDSEPSAIWQCLQGEKQKARRLIITASGGPFLNYSATKMKDNNPATGIKTPVLADGPENHYRFRYPDE